MNARPPATSSSRDRFNTIAAALEAGGLHFSLPPGGGFALEAAPARLRTSTLSVGDGALALGSLGCAHLRVSRDPARVVTIAGKEIALENIVFERAGMRIAIERASGALVMRVSSDDVLTFDELTLHDAVLDITFPDAPTELPMDQQAGAPADYAAQAEARAEASAPPSAAVMESAFDWSFLDRLSGDLDAKIYVEAKVPVIRSRSATHHFKLPIVDGRIRYKDVTSGLSSLEDFVLGFEVKGNELVFEKDIPLIPFDNVTIVSWPLEEGELALAKNDSLVRLRTLFFGWKVPERTAKEEKKQQEKDDKHEEKVAEAEAKGEEAPEEDVDFALQRLDLDPVSGELNVTGEHALAFGGGTIHLGDATHAALDRFVFEGSLFPKKATDARGELRAELGTAMLRFENVRAGGKTLDGPISLGSIRDARLTFDGPRVRTLRMTLGDLVIKGLTLRP